MGYYFWRKSTLFAKVLSLRLFFALGLLWFAAVFLDYASSLVQMSGDFKIAGELAEDGGELVGGSLFLWTCLSGVTEERSRNEKVAHPGRDLT